MLHAIVQQTQPSPEQLPAVTARGHDVLVVAGAGTGKTRTLVARYLSLLADGVRPRFVVAITFTRKAAREMRNRVREGVQRYLQRVDLEPDERERWQALYTELDSARIGTIHSLCTEILRSHPAEADVDPRFQVLEDGQAQILRSRALDEALAWAAQDPPAAAWFALLGERSLREALGSLLQQRLDAQAAFEAMPRDVTRHWRRLLELRQQQALDRLSARPEWRDSIAVLRTNEAERADDAIEVQRRAAVEAISEDGAQAGGRLVSLSRLQRIRLSGGSGRSWPEGPDQMGRVKDALRALRNLWKESDPSRLAAGAAEEELGDAFPALHRLFDFALARYSSLKRQRDALDFDDLEAGALQLLRNHATVLAYWRNQAQAILVDEFQDTNERQRRLVSLLNGDRGRLFVVGDAKQSIYRFRGADVRVFREEREHVRHSGGEVLPLVVSYRAHRALIQGLNALLGPALGETEDPARPWFEPFAALKQRREKPGTGFEGPPIELLLAVGTKKSGALQRAADALAAHILQLVDGKHCVVIDGDLERPLDYGDFAILCRSSNSFQAYEDALERFGVPYLTVAGRGFYDRPEVRDLLNALHAIADPTDDLALAGLLRSPGIAFTDDELYRLCQDRSRKARGTPLWDVLRAGVRWMSIEKGERAVQVIQELRDLVGRTSVADVLKAFLDATDYRAALLRVGQSRAARNVSKLLADAHASGIIGVGAFLEYVSGLRDAGAREGEARAPVEGAVQIMSVHQAKGLEFAVVAIGDVSNAGADRESVLIDPELGVLVPRKDPDGMLPAVYRLGRERDKDMEAAESDRLLYVAATRAKERLIFSGCVDTKPRGASGRLGGWLGRIAKVLGLDSLMLECDAEATQAVHLNLHTVETPVDCTLFGPGCRWERIVHEESHGQLAVAFPPPLLNPVLAGQDEVDAATRERERDPPQRVWRVVPAARHPSAPAWVIGKLVHEGLAAWRWPGDGFDGWAEARARGCGVTDEKRLRNAVQETRRMLQRLAQHTLFAEMNAAEQRLHEVPYSLEVNGHLDSGSIDVLYLCHGQWTVVEFKTDRLRDEAELKGLLPRKDYCTQMQRYARAVNNLVGQHPRMLLCLLDFESRVEVRPLETVCRT